MWPYCADTTATVSEKPEAQIGTLLCLFLKQEFGELEENNTNTKFTQAELEICSRFQVV